MKKALLTICLLLALCPLVLAQSAILTAGAVKAATSAPSGACSPSGSNAAGIRHYNGHIYVCNGGTWADITAGMGTGNVVGPGSATDNAIARFDGTTGKLIQNSTATLDDSGNLAVTSCTGCGGISPGGSGTELQAKNGSNLQALTNSSISGANLWLNGTLGIGLGSVTPPTGLVIGDTVSTTPRGLMSWQASADTASAHVHLRKSRGTFASPTTIVTGDVLGRVVFSGYEGTNYNESAYIRANSIGTVATNRVASTLEFFTSTNAAPSVATRALLLDEAQNATFTGTVATGGTLTLGGSPGVLAASGTGFNLTANGTSRLNYNVTTSSAWNMNGGLVFTTDNSFDIGASGATRPRTIYFGTSLIGADAASAPNIFGSDSTSGIGLNSSSTILWRSGSSLFSTGTQSSTSAVRINGGVLFGFTSGNVHQTAIDLFLRRVAAASLALGATDAAAPVAQTLSVQNVIAGTSNTAGATFTMQGSLATGNAVPGRLHFAGGALSATSGTTQQTSIDRHIMGASKVLSNNATTTLVNVTNTSNTVAAGVIDYTVEVFDGTDVQVEVGSVSYMVSNKGGIWSGNTTSKFGNQQNMTSGTLAVTWSITGANPALLQINANSSLTPSTGYPRVTYSLRNLGQQAVAIQ